MEQPEPAPAPAPIISRRQRRIQAAAIRTDAGIVAEAGIGRRDRRALRKKRMEAALADSKRSPKAYALSAPPELGRRSTLGTRGTEYKIQPLPKNITELPEDMNTKIQLKAAKNEIMMMTNENLQEFRRIIIQCSTLESMTDPTKLRKAKGNKNGSPKLKQCVLARIFKKLSAIKLVDIRIDIETIRVLEFALTYSKIKTILLSNISFDSDVICGRFANLFDETRNVDSIKHLILRGINFLVVNTEIGRRFNIFINNIVKLKNLEELEVSNFNIVKLFFTDSKDITFDYMLVKLIIRLTKLKDLIFTNNIINAYEYEYIFNEYYEERQHCYVIKIMDTKDEKLINGVYVKCNRISEEGEEDESTEYYMDLIYIDTRTKRLNQVYYYSKGNKSSNASRTALPDFINTDFEEVRGVLIQTFIDYEGKGDIMDDSNQAFMLA